MVNGERLQQLHKALLSAFPTTAKLKQMVSFNLDEKLDEIAGGADHSEVVFNLIAWANAQGRLKKLLTAARKDNPDNPDLRRFDEQLLATPIEEEQSEQHDLSDISSNENKRRHQNMNQLLECILNKVPELESIIIFDLNIGLHLYSSSTDPKMEKILFGNNDIGKALEHFHHLKQVSKVLDSFGETTKSGSLQYCIFKLQYRQLMVYFYELPDTSVAICFLAIKQKISLGALISSGESHIQTIKDNF